MKQSNRILEIKKDIKKSNRKLEILRILQLVFPITIVTLLVLTCVIRPIYVNGDSMYPTLEDGEIGVTGIVNRHFGELKRFDIVTVYDESEKKNLAKRVVGLPGETIQYRDDILYVNGNPVEEYFLDDDYVKEQTNAGAINFTSDYGPIVLGDNEYFLCGDNRRISRDSRILGPFKGGDIISKDIFIIFK
ncbi:signal peptidase I [Breznakia sp. PF5-3]|uniref:signal peptidase I n=1 Tax=unclassified Breznakia TaxID=2623764 RepID=UPI002404A68F|nr:MULTISPECIES: signal peptidase I [unclassified Breznakia]MDF9825109.1 signal peptidase I [Breznakia sp. PM6-1]MDF9835956.1 signal peptidase I [Breznakia sp. PF5-3]MDF9837805.1 signal peptidase I [Breznakia sp. PFB2-8]MDF9859725.1 signal peptidase I [Breznakia sp. PH5-24]